MSFKLNLKNFFSESPVSKDQRETIELYERVRKAFYASDLHSTDIENFADTIAYDALQKADRLETQGLLRKVLREIAQGIIEDDGFFQFNDIDISKGLGLEEGVRVRKYLKTKEVQLEDVEKTKDIGFWLPSSILGGILKALPSGALQNIEEIGFQEENFTVSLIDLVENPAILIERLIGTIIDEDVENLHLYEKLKIQLDKNILLASGINPKDVNSKKEFIAPSKVKNKSPQELVEIYLAGTPFRDLFEFKFPFKIPFATRFEHCHIVGGTGHGKTQLLQTLIYQDLLKALEGKGGLCIIDSQGDLINTISHLKIFSPQISESLADKFILVDPNDIEYPVCLNMFDLNLERIRGYKPVEREKILNGTIALYEYIFGALLGAELTQKQGVIFKYLAQIMMVIPGANIHTLRELMEDAEPFRPYIYKLEGTARKFFEVQFFSSTFNDTKKQILNRLWGVLSNRTFEMMFTQERNKIDLFEAMNSGKIVLINTAKDLLKKDGCQILGRFFIAMIAQSALERSTIPADRRRSFFVYIDEAHDYFDENIGDLLNQARKYKVGMVLAHQNLEQLSQKLKATILASTSVKIAGGVSYKDAGIFAKEMNCSPEFIQSARKRKDQTEFACWVRNLTDRAIKISVPLGAIEKLPVMEKPEYQKLIDKNRSLYSGTIKKGGAIKPSEEKGVDGFELGEPEDLL